MQMVVHRPEFYQENEIARLEAETRSNTLREAEKQKQAQTLTQKVPLW